MGSRSYDAILFDLDGTLLNNRASHDAAFAKLCERYPSVLRVESKEQKAALIRLYSVDDPEVVYRKFCRKNHWETPPAFADFWKLWKTFYVELAEPFPNAKETLELLRRNGYRIGMITNGESEFQRAKLRSSGLLPYFDLVVVSGEVGVAKPQAEIFGLCADGLDVEISRCLFVGDNPKTDLAGAENAGMDFMLVRRRKSAVVPTYKASDVSALKEILELI